MNDQYSPDTRPHAEIAEAAERAGFPQDRPMNATYRQDRQTGEITVIQRWKALARLTGNYKDERQALDNATEQAPAATPGALYWTERADA